MRSDNLTLEFLENQKAFNDAVNVYVQDSIDTEDILLKDLPGNRKENKNLQKEIKDELNLQYSNDEVDEMMSRLPDIISNTRKSRISSSELAEILKEFKDTRRLEFLGNWICKYMSELITSVDSDQEIRDLFGISKLNKRKDYFQNIDVRNAIYNNIKGVLKDKAKKLKENGKDELADELLSVVKHFSTLLYMYGGKIFRDEGIQIGIDGATTITSSEETSQERNDTEQSEDDGEDIGETPTNTFSASDQNKSVTSKIAPSIKILLSTLHEVDTKGNDIADPYGYDIHTYISVPKAIQKILALSKGRQKYSEIIDALEKNKKSTPWIANLLDILDTSSKTDVSSDTILSSSKKEQLQSMFYQSARKQFTHMRTSFISRNENGDLTIMNKDGNVGHKSDKLMRQVRNKFKRYSGLPIFSGGMINFNQFNTIATQLSAQGITGKLAEAYSSAKDIAREGFRNNQKQDFKEAFKKLSEAEKATIKVLNDFGINATDNLLNDYLVNSSRTDTTTDFWGSYEDFGDSDFSGRYQRLNSLIKKLKNLNSTFISWGKDQKSGITKDTPLTNPFIRKKGNSDWKDIRNISRLYENIINSLTEFSPDSFEHRAHINGKDYYSWNNPSSVMTITENLSQKDKKKVQDYILEKYCKDREWFLKPDSTTENPHFYSDWLENLYYGTGRDIFAYSEKPSFCGKEYGDMSGLTYSLSILNDYFSPIRDSKDSSWYRMLIASDKPRYSTIKFSRYHNNGDDESKNYHSIIARKAVDFYAQELRRCINVVSEATKNCTKILGYDININNNNKHVFNKINKHEIVTTDDVLDNEGKYLFKGTGASFYLNKFIIKEIENRTALGRYTVDRIFNSWKYTGEKLITEDIIPIFINGEQSNSGTSTGGFHNYMKEIKDDYFRYLDDCGLFDITLQRGESDEESDTVHLKYLLGSMKSWHEDDERFLQKMYSRREQAQEFADEEGIDLKTNPEERTFCCEVIQFKEDLEEFIYNNWLAKANMSEIFDVDLAFYGNTTNFQKRNAQVISSGYVTDPEAKIHGKAVSDGKYRSITIKTEKIESSHLSNLEVLLDKQESRITDPMQKRQFNIGKKDILSALKSFDATDGQALTSLTALRKRMAGQGEWSRSDNENIDNRGYEEINGKKNFIFTDEAVYQRMKRGYNNEIDREALPYDIQHVFAQPQKPFVYSFTSIERDGRTLTVPIQHKNSEYALISAIYFAASIAPNSKMAAIAKFLEQSANDDITHGIDTVNFDSGVKIGNNSKMIDITGLDAQRSLEKIESSVYGQIPTLDEKGRKKYVNGTVTEYDNTDYKIVQQKPEHFKNANQPIGSQIKILAISNIKDNDRCNLPDGTTISGKELRTRYFSALRKKMQDAVSSFEKDMGINLPQQYSIHRLSVALKDAISTDQKFSSETRRALSITERDGVPQFFIPLDEVEQQGAVEALLYSKIRSAYYKEKTKGGIIVQATSWGSSDELHIRFYSSNPEDSSRGGVVPTFEEFSNEHKSDNADSLREEYNAYLKKYQEGYAWFEAEIPMPEYVRNMIANKDGSIDKKFYKEDGTWDMEQIKKVVPSSAFDAICYRVPTEAKYSMMVCKVKRFAPEYSGSAGKYPQELTVFTGSDFDIDTDFVEIRPERKDKNFDVDNELFDLQLAALRSNDSIQETFKQGDFSDLQDLSYRISLIDETKGGLPIEDVMAMTFKEAKDKCMSVEDMDLMNPKTDGLLHKQNTDAKDMIAIAAVGVTSHAFLSLYNDVDTENQLRNPEVHPENFVRVTINEGGKGKICKSFTVVNDKNSSHSTTKYFGGQVFLDMSHDMDGKLISTEISKYVGASADAAKDAAEYRLNINTTTLPLLITMHRLGVSSDVARLFICQPVIRNIINLIDSKSAFYGGISFGDACEEEINKIVAGKKEFNTLVKDVKTSTDNTLVYSELLNNISNPDDQSAYDKVKQIHILQTIADISKGVKNIDSFTRYNSSKAMSGTSFIERYVSTQKLETLSENLNAEHPTILLPEDVQILDEFENDNFGKLCSMFPYIADTILGERELTQEVILENMHTYGKQFFDAVGKIFNNNFDRSGTVNSIRRLYQGWKNYLLFVGDQRIADFTDKKTVEYYTKDFAQHYAEKLEELQKDSEFYNKVIKNNSFINSIGFKSTGNGYEEFDVLDTDITGISDTVLENYKRDWENLLNYEQTRQFVIDTSIHFLARAAAFSRDTPVHVMPLAIKEAIPNYINTFVNADKISMDDTGLNQFIEMYQRNNSDDKLAVPHFRSNRNTNNISFDQYNEKDNTVQVSFKSAKVFGFNNWISKNLDGNLVPNVPVIKVDDMLISVDMNDTFNVGKDVDGDMIYTIQGSPVSPLGVPNIISEYVGFYSPDSMFESIDENMTSGQTQLDAEIESPIDPNNVLTSFDRDESISIGQKVGTFITSSPYGSEEIDADYNKALAEDVFDRSGLPYSESKTFLRRANMIASLFNVKLSSVRRGYRNGYNSYDINITDDYRLFDKDKKYSGSLQHENALKYATLLSALGSKWQDDANVKTYVKDITKANSIEYSIKLNKTPNSDKISEILKQLPYSINTDSNELLLYADIPSSKDITMQNEGIKTIVNSLIREGIASDSDIEANFIKSTSLGQQGKIELLTELINESNEYEQQENGIDKDSQDSDRKEVRISDLAYLALKKVKGEKVEGDIRKLFNESRKPLKSADASYTSRELSDSVLDSFATNDELYTEVSQLIYDKSDLKHTESDLLDNIIINTANWIIGGNTDAVQEMLERGGLTAASSSQIISVIQEKLKELDIC